MKIVTTLFLFLAISCSAELLNPKTENEKFIQGKWHLSGTTGDDDKIAWFLEWEFNDGNFTQNGYPPIRKKGKHKVIKDEENSLTLKLFEQKGTWGEAASDLKIIVDRKNNTLSIQRKSGFKKVTNEERT
ncbi:MAG: hypothetical protein HKN25_05075 [Pyrinomonadaceae bacterium]|nr:hypothetical protein [Pyrinomonadaceae bacterium]